MIVCDAMGESICVFCIGKSERFVCEERKVCG